MDTTATKAAEQRLLQATVSVGLMLAAMPAASLEFEPRVTLGITYTDNVSLEPVDEQDETIYRAEPGFALTHETSRVNLTADYLMQAFRYADLGQSEVYHQYNANLRTDLVRDTVFLDIGGNRSQSILDPELNIPQTNLPISGNRQDRDEYYVSPSFQYALGSTLTAGGSYRNTWVDYSEGGPGRFNDSSENRDAQFSLDNYRRGVGLAWALRYEWRRTEYDEEFEPFEYQQAAAELGFWLSGSTRIFASGGKESAWDAPLDPALEDNFWEAGFVHQVGERLSAEFAAGERSFGSSWRGNLELTFRRGSTSLSYSETPTTESRNRSRVRSADFTDPVRLDDFLARPGSGDRFIAKRLEWRLDYALTRTTFSVAAFSDERTDRTEADGTMLADEEQQGINAAITYRVGARTDVGFSGSFARRDFRDGEESDLIRAGVSVDYRLGARTNLRLEYDYTEEDADVTARARDYVANTVSLLLTRTF